MIMCFTLCLLVVVTCKTILKYYDQKILTLMKSTSLIHTSPVLCLFLCVCYLVLNSLSSIGSYITVVKIENSSPRITCYFFVATPIFLSPHPSLNPRPPHPGIWCVTVFYFSLSDSYIDIMSLILFT